VKVLHMAAVELGLDVVETGSSRTAQPAHHTAGGAGPAVLLLGHTDVVPVGDDWTTDRSAAPCTTAACTAAAPPT